MKKYIVEDLDTLMKHVDVSGDFSFSRIEPFIKRVEKNMICKYISRQQYIEFLKLESPGEYVLEVLDHLESAIGHFALMQSMVHLQNAVGTNGADEENKRDWWRDKDLLRSYRTIGMESFDMALNMMADQVDSFAEYKVSAEYIKSKNLVIKNPEDFSELIDINNSRLTFDALVSIMKFIQVSEFSTIDKSIFLNPTSDVHFEALFFLKGIIAHRTKAQIIISNKFSFDGLGFSYKIELLPWENKSKLDKDILERQVKNELHTASIYRQEMWDLMNANKSEFNIPEVKRIDFVTKNQSSLGLL